MESLPANKFEINTDQIFKNIVSYCKENGIVNFDIIDQEKLENLVVPRLIELVDDLNTNVTEYVYDDIREYIINKSYDLMKLICPIIDEFSLNVEHLRDIDLEFDGIVESGLTFEGHHFNLPSP